MQISFICSSCLANMVGILATKITFGDTLTFHQRGLCVSGSDHVTNGDSGGMILTAGLELPYPRGSQAKFRDETSRSFLGKVM